MAYSDFDLKKVRNAFGLRIDEQPDLFADVTPVQPGATLANTLAETAHLAMAINTEKARSELLITPVLLDIWRQAQSQVSLFSGTEFNVDEVRGLTGYCDCILSQTWAGYAGPEHPSQPPEEHSLLPDIWECGSASHRGARCGTTARRALGGGRRVTGVPTATASSASTRGEKGDDPCYTS